jgi:hypothetical protein
MSRGLKQGGIGSRISSRYRQRGLRAVAAFEALGRKLARVCFALAKNGAEF